MRRTFRNAALLSAVVLLGSCSSPGSNVEVEGTYTGTILQSPKIALTLVISGNTITGTGVVQADAAGLWRGDPASTDHITFAGTRSGRQIVTLNSAVSHIQYNTTPFGETPTWVDGGVTMSLARNANVNDNNGITGLWQGSSTAVTNPLGGTWSVVKGGGAAGLVRP